MANHQAEGALASLLMQENSPQGCSVHKTAIQDSIPML